jgi:hypothetical protein
MVVVKNVSCKVRLIFDQQRIFCECREDQHQFCLYPASLLVLALKNPTGALRHPEITHAMKLFCLLLKRNVLNRQLWTGSTEQRQIAPTRNEPNYC